LLMGMDEAKSLRLQLMDERILFADAVEDAVDSYNLCEH